MQLNIIEVNFNSMSELRDKLELSMIKGTEVIDFDLQLTVLR